MINDLSINSAKKKIPLFEAAELLGVSRYKMSRLVARGMVATSEDPLDERVKLVDQGCGPRLESEGPGSVKTIVIANHKGGCAETTTALNLGIVLAAQDAKVLTVDLDPQGNL